MQNKPGRSHIIYAHAMERSSGQTYKLSYNDWGGHRRRRCIQRGEADCTACERGSTGIGL